ncbi:MAG: hypothetical protein ACI4ST_00510 [Candidatus Gallimonas sp.]
MEFFAWLTIPQIIYSYFMTNSLGTYREYLVYIIICCAVAGALYLVSLVFGGIGLRKMAKNAGIKRSFLAFLPFANTYFAGKVAGEANFFGQKMKRAGLYAMLAEILYVAINALGIVIGAFLANPAYYREVETVYGEKWKLMTELVPPQYRWMIMGSIWCEVLGYLAEIILIVFLFVVYIALYRKYYARSPMLMAFLSAFLPCRGFVLFAVRNNTPVDYNAFMKRRMEDAMRQQREYFGGSNPQNGSYGGGSYDDGSPFSDFGGDRPADDAGSTDDNPFSEFGDTPPKD